MCMRAIGKSSAAMKCYCWHFTNFGNSGQARRKLFKSGAAIGQEQPLGINIKGTVQRQIFQKLWSSWETTKCRYQRFNKVNPNILLLLALPGLSMHPVERPKNAPLTNTSLDLTVKAVTISRRYWGGTLMAISWIETVNHVQQAWGQLLVQTTGCSEPRVANAAILTPLHRSGVLRHCSKWSCTYKYWQSLYEDLQSVGNYN